MLFSQRICSGNMSAPVPRIAHSEGQWAGREPRFRLECVSLNIFLPINFRRKSLILLVNFRDKMNAFKKMKRFILTSLKLHAFNLSA